LATELTRFEYDRALLVLDKETDYQTWCNHFLGVIKGSLDQMLKRDAARENSSLD
jgi:hypothetical protein